MPEQPRVTPGALALDAPLSSARAEALVDALPLAPGRHALDLGCGRGELLLRIVEAHPAATGTGVDRRRPELDAARREAARRRLADRVDFVEADPAAFDDRGDVVVSIALSGLWGGTTQALRALHGRVERGGELLFGERVWLRPAGAAARAALGDLPVFDGLVAAARAAGFRVDRAEHSTPEEWRAYAAAASEVPDDRRGQRRRQELEECARGVLGFAWLVLARA